MQEESVGDTTARNGDDSSSSQETVRSRSIDSGAPGDADAGFSSGSPDPLSTGQFDSSQSQSPGDRDRSQNRGLPGNADTRLLVQALPSVKASRPH